MPLGKRNGCILGPLEQMSRAPPGCRGGRSQVSASAIKFRLRLQIHERAEAFPLCPNFALILFIAPSGGQNIVHWINLGAFAIPGCPTSTPVCSNPANVGRFGNSGLDTLEGPPMRNVDFALMKNFHTTERFVWQIEVQAQDALNHPNFGNPSANISAPATGAAITSTLTNDLQGSGASRSIYVMVKVNF